MSLDQQQIRSISAQVGLRRRSGRPVLTWFHTPVAQLDDPLVATRFAGVIYRWAYAVGRPQPIPDAPPPPRGTEPAEVYDPPRTLAAWDIGWTAGPVVDGGVTVRREGDPALRVRPDDFKLSTSTTGPGGTGAVRLRSVSTRRQPGFLSVLHGHMPLPVPLVRLYLNSHAGSVTTVANLVVDAALNHAVPAFAFKWLLGPDHDERADSFVVYLPRAAAEPMVRDLIDPALGLPALLRAPVPMFTTRRAAGVATALSPPGDRSFGQDCAQTAAAQILADLRAPARRSSGRRIAGSGTAGATGPELPHLPLKPVDGPDTLNAETPAAALMTLAHRLTREAVIDGRRATWLVPQAARRWRSTGPDVYGGSPGSILVLAHACRLSEDPSMIRVMRAAAADVADRARDLPGRGFHDGPAGTAAVLAEAATISGDPMVAERAREILALACAGWDRATPEWDVLSGHAGFALGVIAASRLLGQAPPIRAADALQALTAAAVGPDGFTAWPTVLPSGRRVELTGVAHGASGAALALATGNRLWPNEEWARTVRSALAFEDRHRRADTGGWIDRRRPGRREMVAWCHGAAGIGMVAALLNSPPGSAPELAERLQVAAARIRSTPAADNPDNCLCHGAIGNALALREIEGDTDRSEWSRVAGGLPRPATASAATPLGLMTGRTGDVLARHLLADRRPAPVAFRLVVDGPPMP